MIGTTFSLDLGIKLDLSAGIDKQVFPLLNQAVKAIAQKTAQNWQEEVLRAKLWSGERDAYAQSITWRMTGDFTAMIESDYRHAEAIETGRPADDLKRMLNTSVKVRTTESGKRFLVIPFRHNTPGHYAHARSMPDSVYELAKSLALSRIVSQGKRRSGEVTALSPAFGMKPSQHQKPHPFSLGNRQPVTVNRNRYEWGGRINMGALKNLGVDVTTQRHMQGMVRFDTSQPGKKSSVYMTFRIMMQGETGWIIPAQTGKYLVKKVVDNMRPKAQAAFAEAVRLTLRVS